MVNFVPAVTALTLFIAFIGGLLMGIAKHILPEQPNKKPEEADNQGNLAKKLKNALTSAEFYKYPCHGFFGIVVYLLFFFKVAYLDRLNIPTDVNWGIFVIGVIGGISFYPIMHGIEKVMGWK